MRRLLPPQPMVIVLTPTGYKFVTPPEGYTGETSSVSLWEDTDE